MLLALHVEESGTLSAKSLVGCAGRLPAGMTCTRHVLYLPVMIDPQQVEGMPNSQQSTTTRTVAVRGWMADVAIFLDPVSWENAQKTRLAVHAAGKTTGTENKNLPFHGAADGHERDS